MVAEKSEKQSGGAQGPRGKKTKHFLGQQDALILATTIIKSQEQRQRVHKEETKMRQLLQPQERSRKSGSSRSKKLREAKAILSAAKARQKREKAKSKAQVACQSPDTKAQDSVNCGDAPQTEVDKGKRWRKSVAFA
ncbi:hypothetical protein NP233_g4919 [Leucocoprinus birnbaumii]|uniref:Uncharacterized protein n=1 Tax=Leucocoprinus birnbaumii TaxID=56174 RepID=A0AAD5YSD1_9AGAR|nr:hypothetical protein NP233_g4919 [Leucocoprinus birnbaumii]